MPRWLQVFVERGGVGWLCLLRKYISVWVSTTTNVDKWMWPREVEGQFMRDLFYFWRGNPTPLLNFHTTQQADADASVINDPGDIGRWSLWT